MRKLKRVVEGSRRLLIGEGGGWGGDHELRNGGWWTRLNKRGRWGGWWSRMRKRRRMVDTIQQRVNTTDERAPMVWGAAW